MALKNTLRYALLIGLAILFLFPFLAMVMVSFQKTGSMISDPLFWIPKNPTLFNFHYILTQDLFARWIGNTIILTVVPLLGQMFISAGLGYVYAKKEFRGKEFTFWLMMAIVMVPSQLVIIPNYLMFSKFGWINTFWPVIVPQLWNMMNVFLVRQFLQTVPKDMDEAAYIDGASDFKIFFRIMLPLSMPAIATVGTLAFIHGWNDLFTPLIYMSKQNMFPISVGLASLLTIEGNTGYQMAGAVLSFVPTFLIFIFFQRYFTEGISLSGLK